MNQQQIYISETDRVRLTNLIELVRSERDRANLSYARKLEDGLDFAEVVEPAQMPSDVVTMRSKLKLKDLQTNEEAVYSIVFPTEANVDEGMISVLTPLAAALLGHRRGAIVEFQAPGRLRTLEILEILYQPESAGDYNL
jgi:regulator of nucleoside diphosphate kinase